MSLSFNNSSKTGEGERIVSHLNGLGLTFAPSDIEESEQNSLFSVYHFRHERNTNCTKWVKYKEIVENKCHPDNAMAGKEQKIIVNQKTRTTMTVPDETDGLEHRVFDHGPTSNPIRQTIIGRPKYEFTVLPVKGYTKHLKCSVYIEKIKQLVIGKIVKLRSSIMNAIMFYAQRYRYLPEVYTSQYQFASHQMTGVIVGLTSFNDLPLDVMNTKSIMTYIDGVNSVELAKMVKMVATTSSIQVNVRNFPEMKNFYVECIFDNIKRYSFGKGLFKKFDHLVENVDERGLAPFSIVCSDSHNVTSPPKKKQRIMDVETKCFHDVQHAMNDGDTEEAENDINTIVVMD
jgi:hypothetical protein